jgi:hypothetical protein
MPPTVSANGLTIVHQGSGAICTATIPDVCKTPSSAGPIPLPYPNIAVSADLVAGTTTITLDGQPAAIQSSKFAKSTGDEAGSLGGVASGVFIGETSFISFSPNVFFEGKPVVRLTDKALMNKGNTVCAAGVVVTPVLVSSPMLPPSGEGSAVDHPEDPSRNSSPFVQKAAKPCTLTEFTMACSHSARKYAINGLKTPGATLEILRGKDPDPVKFGLVGTCGFHSGSTGDCPWIEVRDRNYHVVNQKGEGQVQFPKPGGSLVDELMVDTGQRGSAHPEHTAEIGFIDTQLFWVRYVFSFKDIPMDVYEVRVLTCGGGTGLPTCVTSPVWIRVYPNFSWKGDLWMGYEYEKESVPKGEKPSNKLDPTGYFGIGAAVELVYCGSTKKIDFSFNARGAHKDDLGPLSSGPFSLAQSFISKFAGKFEDLERFTKREGAPKLYGRPVDKVEIKWPKVSFGGGAELVEKEASPVVYRKGEIHFKFSPLIGFEISTDLLEWLIRIAATAAIPGGGAVLAKFLLAAKKWAAGDADDEKEEAEKKEREKEELAKKGKVAKIGAAVKPKAKAILELRLTVEGEIGGGLGFEWGGAVSPDQKLLEAKVGFTLVGRAYGEVRVWKVSASACAEISAKGRDGTEFCGIIGSIIPKKSKDGFSTSGELKFTGLAIYYLLYYEYGSAAAEAAPKVAEGKDFGAHFSKDSKTRKEKKNCLAVLFEAHTWKIF